MTRSLRCMNSAPSPKGARKRILLVDDDRSVRESLSLVLLGEGYLVLTAGNGDDALKLAGESPLDLVILDLNMPVKNGWDTFEQFSREHPLLPVVIATARSNQLFTAMGAGVAALLEKPLDIPELLLTVNRLLTQPQESHLARLAGKESDMLYSPAAGKEPTGVE